jgi:hypothetical protein
MSFWNGSRWVEDKTAPSAPRPSRAANWAATIAMLIGLAVVAAPLGMIASAAHRQYAGTLTATPNALHAGDSFTVSGCGYDKSLGNVVVGFTGGGWGSPLDADGCFNIAGIPALSGDTLPAGVYEVYARQYVHKKWTVTGETTVTVLP